MLKRLIRKWVVSRRYHDAICGVHVSRSERLGKANEQLMTDNALLKRIIQQGDSTAAQMRRKIVSLEARAIGGDENCPQCARLRRRITRFFEQKRIIKAAYVENVMMVSHGQVDRRALIEAERYLLVDSDDEIRTFGEIRDSEIERSLSLLKHVKTQKQIENETTTNPNS